MKNTDLWEGPVHQAFIAALDGTQLQALWELLLVATFADDELSLEERRDLAGALREAPGFADAASFEGSSDDIDRLYVAYGADPKPLLADIARRLGDDAARRGAFRTAAQLVKSEGLADAEAAFVREIGTQLGLEPEVIEFAINF